MGQSSIDIPYNFKPREYQREFMRTMNEGCKRGMLIWHRRSGKDKTIFNHLVKEATKKTGVYYYFFPTYKQGKKIIWDGIDGAGFRFLDHIPKEIRDGSPNETEMKVRLKNGSIIQIVGTDNVDSVVGTNPIGCVFSEYSLQDPIAWDYIRPILAENGGWAVFCFTPRGQNHAYLLSEYAKSDPNWFVQVLTVDDTKAIPKEVLEQEYKEIVAKNGDDSLYLQEYYCSFEASIQGAYYAKEMQLAEKENRITTVAYDSNLATYTAWDIGVGDATAIWFYQKVGAEVRLIDYYETSGEGLAHYAKVLQDKGYVYKEHFAPHDIQVRELSSGNSRLEIARSLGINFTVIPNLLSIDDGINAVRGTLANCWFDKERCKQGILAVKNYRKEFDEKNSTYKLRPVHDWSSHGADAFRYLAISLRSNIEVRPHIPNIVTNPY